MAALVHIQSTGKVFLECSQFFGKLAIAEQRLTHLDEGADDEHAQLDGAWAAKNIRCL